MKIFLVGLPKAGTSTLHRALASSGLRSVHWRDTDTGAFVGRTIYQSYLRGRDPLESFTAYDAITQADYISHKETFWPQCDFGLLKKIQSYHPDCVFFLNLRDPVLVTDSICRWNDLQDRLTKVGAPGLPPGFAADRDNITEWVRNHYSECRAFLSGYTNFFEIEIGHPHARQQIGARLGIDIQWWGVANSHPKPHRTPLGGFRSVLRRLYST